MRTLDDQLNEAAAALRAASQKAPNRPWVSPGVLRRPRLFAALAGATLVVVAVGLPALWLATQNNAGQGNGSVAPAAQPALDETGTTVSQTDTSQIQGQMPLGEFQYLTLRIPGWRLSEATERTSNASGKVVSISITLTEITEDRTGDEVILEFGEDGGWSGEWAYDFLSELEVSGIDEQRAVVIRGKAGLLRKSGSGLWGLQWTEAPGTEALLLLLPDGTTPDVLLELAEALEPMSDEEWIEMTATTATNTDSTYTVTNRFDTTYFDTTYSKPTTLSDSPIVEADGTPISDGEFSQLFGENVTTFIPGTAYHIASTEVPGLGTLDLYTVRRVLPGSIRLRANGSEIGTEISPPTEYVCVYETGLDLVVGSALCSRDASILDFGISVGGSCAPTIVQMISMWGLNPELSEVVVSLTDGTEHTIRPVNGVALWAWKGQIGLAGLNVVGASDQVIAQFNRVGNWLPPQLPYFSCGESHQGDG